MQGSGPAGGVGHTTPCPDRTRSDLAAERDMGQGDALAPPSAGTPRGDDHGRAPRPPAERARAAAGMMWSAEMISVRITNVDPDTSGKEITKLCDAWGVVGSRGVRRVGPK